MRFRDIKGQEDVVKTLRDMADTGRIPHAILLGGPSGLGKMMLARAFAQYINCEHRSHGDSCGLCPSCRRMEAFSNPDIHYVYPIVKREQQKITVSSDILPLWQTMLRDHPYMPVNRWLDIIDAGNSQPQILVPESEDISHTASLSTFADRFKIFIIWLPEKLQTAAANKLLKVIEEPHDDTLFICVSNQPREILPTIISRLRRIELHRPSDEIVAKALAEAGVSMEKSLQIAGLANGSIGDALELALSSADADEFGEDFRQAMRYAYSRNVAALRALADRAAALGRTKAVALAEYFARQVRENFIANLRMPALNTMNAAETDFSNKFAPFIHHNNVTQIIGDIDDLKRDITRNSNSKLAWFDFLLRLMINIRKTR